MFMKSWMQLGVLILVVFLFFGCTHNDKGVADSFVPSQPVKDIVLDGLKRPWGMAFISENVALVTEKDGDLLRINLASKERHIIQGIPTDRADSIVTDAGDASSLHYPFGIQEGLKATFNAGLLDVVLDPDFENNSRLFLSYVAEAPEGTTTRVISARLENDQLLDIKQILLALPFSDGSFHYGGGMTIGADGKLYIAVGDRLFSEALQPALPYAQDLADHRGMFYRFNLDGSVPADNPVLGREAVSGAYAHGIRNVQGLSVSPVSGEIWFSEHGTLQGDELNVLKAGANYGWPLETSGKYRAPNYAPPVLENVELTAPKWFWQHTVAPTGLTFYTGEEFPEWKNDLLVSGLSRGNLWRFRIENETIRSTEELFVDDRHRARNIVQGPAGKLYVLTDEVDGKIIRIRNAGG